MFGIFAGTTGRNGITHGEKNNKETKTVISPNYPTFNFSIGKKVVF